MVNKNNIKTISHNFRTINIKFTTFLEYKAFRAKMLAKAKAE